MKKLRLIRYSGNKLKYTDIINNKINELNTTKMFYIEPFIGSASIFLNLKHQFKKYCINDSDKNICKILKTFSKIDYQEFLDFYNRIIEKFGDIGKDKESYYNFRNWFNKEYWGKDTILEGIGLFILYNSCINSFARFGPNGFNQSFGYRNYSKNYTLEIHDKIKEKLSISKIFNENYDSIFKYDREDILWIFDPPYFFKPSSYKGFSKEEFYSFLEKISKLKGKVIYTDILHQDIINSTGFKYIEFRQMLNTSPLKNSEKTEIECMYSNF